MLSLDSKKYGLQKTNSTQHEAGTCYTDTYGDKVGVRAVMEMGLIVWKIHVILSDQDYNRYWITNSK